MHCVQKDMETQGDLDRVAHIFSSLQLYTQYAVLSSDAQPAPSQHH